MAVIPGEDLAKIIEVLPKQIQPAGIDLTLHDILKFKCKGKLLDDNVVLPSVESLFKENTDTIHLTPGAYKVKFNEVIKIPSDCIGIVLPRSSLLRMGATILTALWDPGYVGKGESLMVVFNQHGIVLKRNVRIAQLFLIKLTRTPSKLYCGRYQYEGLR